MRLVLDTSALAKRYVEEPGSETVEERCREAEEILLSVIAIPEVLSGFNRLRRQSNLSDSNYAHLKRAFAADIEQISILDLSPAILQWTTRCLEAAPLRAMDAIHVASSIEARADLFLSADRRQCRAARELGVVVEDLSLEKI